MKKLFIFFLIINSRIVFAQGDSLMLASVIPPGDHGFHYISNNEMIKMMKAYLTDIYETSTSSVQSLKWGGYIPRDKILTDESPVNNSTIAAGLIFFFCLDIGQDEVNVSDDRLLLATTKVTDFSFKPSYDVKSKPFDVFSFYLNGIVDPTELQIQERLRATQVNPPAFESKTYAQIEPLITNFANSFNSSICKYSLPPPGQTASVACSCNTKVMNFIESESIRNILLNQPNVTGFHFYLGYDESENFNKIRLVFIPTVNDKNELTIGGNSGPIYNNYIERAWP